MPLGSYTADPDNAAQPLDTVSGGYAARELRALKAKINEQIQQNTSIPLAGGPNAYTCAGLPSSLVTGQIYVVRCNVACAAGGVTITPGGGSPIPLVNANGSTLLASQIEATQILILYANGPDLRLANQNPVIASLTQGGIVRLDNSNNSSSVSRATTPNQIRLLREDLDDAESDIATLDAIKAPIDTPVFTGIPRAPTPVDNDNSTRLATTAFVDRESNKKANLAGSTGQAFSIASAGSSNTVAIRRTDYATNSLGGTVKMRVDTTNKILYIRNDGTNA